MDDLFGCARKVRRGVDNLYCNEGEGVRNAVYVCMLLHHVLMLVGSE